MKTKSLIPEPPNFALHKPHYRLHGDRLTLIWVMNDDGLKTIETHYVTAPGVMALLKVSKSTAYRLLHETYLSQARIWWLIDYRDPVHPRQRLCTPKQLFESYYVRPVGNPHFSNGMYQQDIARRRVRSR